MEGDLCDQCKYSSFDGPNEENNLGCSSCWCSDMSSECKSTDKKWTTFGPKSDDKFTLVSASGEELTSAQPNMKNQGRSYLAKFSRISQSQCFWQLPKTFVGNKLAVYGGEFKFTVKNGLIPKPVQLIITGNGQQTMQNVAAGVKSVMLKSDGNWRSGEGYRRNTTRQELMTILANVDEIRLSACSGPYTHETELIDVEMDMASNSGHNGQALSVEECTCPTGYTGASCESCAPGWYRISSSAGKIGVFGECKKCACGNNEECEDETGKCKVSFYCLILSLKSFQYKQHILLPVCDISSRCEAKKVTRIELCD